MILPPIRPLSWLQSPDRVLDYRHKPFVLDSVSVGRIVKAYCKTDPKDARRMAKVYLCGLAEEVWIPDVGTHIAIARR